MNQLGRTSYLLAVLAATALLAACRPETEAAATAVPLSPTADTQIEITSPTPPSTALEPAAPSKIPTATAAPTDIPETPTPTATATPSPTPTPPPPPLNDLTTADFLIMDEDVAAHIQEIHANGQVWGRDSGRFSVLGDSTVLNPHLLARFGEDDLVLGEYAYLQPTVNHFAGTWNRYGVAARNGLHSWSVFDPLWANKDWCEPNEDLLSCEFRLNNPGFLIIRLGSNDAGSPSGFAYNVRQVIEHTIASGIVPILIVKPDRFEGDNTNNEILLEIGAQYNVPLWNLDRVAETLPGKGLDEDQIHMKEYVGNDFTDPAIFESGHGMQDLSGLMVLHAILATVQSPTE